ncbi:DUF998 domain-containing protein [Xanthomonas sp. 3058]|uniref:DUF998 domain-containing protein n=1 Tax=Xanthomonas sp. 3058 TaxID=3035314 RepID=UPI0016217A5D|nr:DUF998 domain-containing protein [Xanthomonas sp. 3058]
MHGRGGLKVHAACSRECRRVNRWLGRAGTVPTRDGRAHHRAKAYTRAAQDGDGRDSSCKADRVLMRTPHRRGTVAHAAPPPWSGLAAVAAVWMGVAFIGLVLALQWLRGDLWWIDAQLSAYLHGPYGLLLRTAYCLLAAVMAWMALGLHAALAPVARSRTVVGLFWAASAGLSAVAIGDSWMPELAPHAAPMVHVLSADATFLCVIAAVLLQSWYFRRDRFWRQRFVPAFSLGLLAFAVLLCHVTVTGAPPGISQKTAIVLIVGWMVAVGAWLARHVRAEAARSAHSRDNAGVNQR